MKAFWLCFPSIACNPYMVKHVREAMSWEQAGESSDIHAWHVRPHGCRCCDVYCSIGYLSCESFHCYLSICLPTTKMTKDSTEAVANRVCRHIFDILPRRRCRFLQIDRKIRPLHTHRIYTPALVCVKMHPARAQKWSSWSANSIFLAKNQKRVLWGCFALRRPLQPTRYPEWPDVRW